MLNGRGERICNTFGNDGLAATSSAEKKQSKIIAPSSKKPFKSMQMFMRLRGKNAAGKEPTEKYTFIQVVFVISFRF